MTKPRNFADILSRLPDARQNGDNWIASCPAPGHKTPVGHLTLKDAGDKALVTCQGGRHSYPDICESLGFTRLTYNSVGGDTTGGQRCNTVTRPAKQGDLATKSPLKSVTGGCNRNVHGVTLETLAEVKCLPVDFLKSLGVSSAKYSNQPAVRIPYYGEDGEELAVRFRLALSGDSRFVWRKGDHTLPYGLNIAKIRKQGWALIVEGETDCWTCWLHDIPALGAPGKSNWPSSWGEYLRGLTVFVWVEPDAEDFALRILKSVDDLRVIRAPEGIKDISEAHIQGQDVSALIAELKAKAESGEALKAHYDNERLSQLYVEARAIIEAEAPLEVIKDAISGQGYGGDVKPALITYLAATSRLLQMHAGGMPVHLLITGLSSAGKSYTLALIKRLLPDEAYHAIDAGSPRTIIYDDCDLQHRVLVFGEADSLPAGEDNPAASAIRNLLQDHNLHYEVTIRDAESGSFKVQKIDKPGPTVLITTAVRSLGAQLMTRLFTVEVADSKKQIRAALEVQATLETEGLKPLDGALIGFQHWLQLKAPWEVVVPYARELAREMDRLVSMPRILRDYQRLLSLIKASAILHHYRRETDNKGRLVASLADYEMVRELVNDMYIDSSTNATEEIRTLVQVVKDMKGDNDGRITFSTLANRMGIDREQSRRRVKKAIRQEWLVNREHRKNQTADIALGAPMPEADGLPTVAEVLQCYTVHNEGVTDSEGGFRYESSPPGRPCYNVTPLTDDNTPPPAGLPCYKGPGICTLRTDASLPFQCNEPPGRCSFLIPANNPSHPSPPAEPCGACGGVDFWVTDWGSRLCRRCHPKPEGEQI